MGGRLRRCRRQLCPLLTLLTFIVLLTFVFYGRNPPRVKARFPVGRPSGVSPYVTTFPRSHGNAPQRSSGSDVKTILLWTEFFGSNTWGTTDSTFKVCAVKKCRVTANKQEAKNADAILANIRDLSSVSDLPSSHPPHQVWVLHSSEPPYYVYLDLDSFRGVFNWTSWYRSDADIFSPYGTYSLLHPPSQTNRSQQWAADDTHRQIRGLNPDSPNLTGSPKAADLVPDATNGHYLMANGHDQNPNAASGHGQIQQAANSRGITSANGGDPIPNAVKGGDPIPNAANGGDPIANAAKDVDPVADAFRQQDRLVFWAASSCLNHDQRYRLVGELQRFLPVDTYGSCGQLSCERHTEQCRSTMARYKFVLAFENGYCRDYITEKYWNALDRFQIPVVMGGADYSRLAVPGSYIDVDNFTSVADLAAFLLRVARDRQLYQAFHAWRRVYQVNGKPVVNWCQLCQALHDDGRPAQAYSDLKGWIAEDTCPLHSPYHHYVWGKTYHLYRLFGI